MRNQQRWVRGSISIEASVSLVLFLFVTLGLLFFIRISRIQAAVQYSLNMAALEMSQYTYLYYASGLYDLDQDIKASGADAQEVLSDATDRLDQSALGIETIFSSITSDGINAVNDLTQGNVDGALEQFKEQSALLQSEGKNIAEQMDGLKDLATQVGSDPVSFARSLAALAGSTGLDALKGRLIGGLFGRSMCEKYIGNGQDADEWLTQMGVSEGLDGLNFNWSSVLGGTAGAGEKDPTQDIDLVVTYQVKVFPDIYDDMTVTFAQSASTRAWLGGDAKLTHIEPLPESSSQPETPEPSPTTSAEPEKNIWEIENNLEKGAAMKELIQSEYEGVGFVTDNSKLYGYQESGNVFYNCTAMDVYAKSYSSASAINSSIKTRAKNTVRAVLSTTEVSMDNGTVHTVDPAAPASVELLVVIPENAADRQAEIQEMANKAAQSLNTTYQEQNITDNIRVVTGGGDSPKASSGDVNG